jgi:N-acyl-D-aspartate/D-glutamate deacylase
MLDLLIKNGRVVDGTGAPAVHADIGIKDGRIASIGESGEPAAKTLDAKGQVVAPGFIDVHTHYDAQVFWDPTLSPSCYHGVTTVFGGHCGFSIAPLNAEAAPYLLRMLARVEGMPENSLQEGVPWDWQSFGEYLGKLDGNLGVNAGFMAGHSAIRRVVMGPRAVGERATAEELEAMKQLLAQSIQEGAMGFSSTLSPTHNDADGQPVPSRHATDEELLELARVVGLHEGTSIEFLPGVGEFSDEIQQLMSDLSTVSHRPVNWNVLNPGPEAQMANQLGMSDVARKNGGKVVALTVPQPIVLRLNLYGGMVFDAMEGWADLFELPIAERMQQLKDPAVRKALDAGAKSGGYFELISDWNRWAVHATFDPANKSLEGLTLGEIAKAEGKDAFDVMLDLALSEGLRTSFIPLDFAGGEDESLWQLRGKLWADDRTVIGASDAGAHLDMIDTFAFSTQVLGNGVREHGVISLEQGVHQITQVPAELLGLRERGVLREGWHADIVIFDPDEVGPGPTYFRSDLPAGEPRVYADALGINHVFVNGTQIVRDGEHTGAHPGKALRSGTDTYTPTLN